MGGIEAMTAAQDTITPVPWWNEPTKDQWLAFGAAWMGWTLDAFDFTMFLLIMVPISQEFHVPLTDVAFVLSVTLWLRLVGAVGSGWLADRVGRKIPLMISILWYSLSNFAAGFSPTISSFSALCSASVWVRSGPPARHWRWRLGRYVRAASWAASCKAHGVWASCYRARSMACSTATSAGVACCGSGSSQRFPFSMSASTSKSRPFGSRTGD